MTKKYESLQNSEQQEKLTRATESLSEAFRVLQNNKLIEEKKECTKKNAEDFLRTLSNDEKNEAVAKLSQALSNLSDLELEQEKALHSGWFSFITTSKEKKEKLESLRDTAIEHRLILQDISFHAALNEIKKEENKVTATNGMIDTILKTDEQITLIKKQAKKETTISLESIALDAWDSNDDKELLLNSFKNCTTKNTSAIYFMLNVKAAEEKVESIGENDKIAKAEAKRDLIEAKIEKAENSGDKEEVEKLEKDLEDQQLLTAETIENNHTKDKLKLYKALQYIAEHKLKKAKENNTTTKSSWLFWFSSKSTKDIENKDTKKHSKDLPTDNLAKIDDLKKQVAKQKLWVRKEELCQELGVKDEERLRDHNDLAEEARGRINKDNSARNLKLASAVVRLTEARLAHEKLKGSGSNTDEIKEIEKDLIEDKINQLNLEIKKLHDEQKKAKDKTPENKEVKLFQELKDLFSPNYNNEKKNAQATKIKGLYFLGQFDYSLLRVLKDALVFSVAGGPALAILKTAVVFANFMYQAFHAKFLSIVESKNRSRFHITNMLFAGFFILFMLTISGMIPCIIPAAQPILWLGPSINILLANPWIALNYIMVELLGVRKMDMDLQTVVNDTFDRPEIGRAQINMAVFGNLGALTSSLLLVYLLSSFTLISKVKIAVALVTVSTILSSIIFTAWASNAEGKKRKSGVVKDTSLLDMINGSSLSFEEIKKILEDKKKDLHEDMRVEEEIYISQKSSIFQKIGYLFTTPSLRAFFGIIAACTAAITVIEIIWKGEVNSYAKTHNADYGSIMGMVNSLTSIGSILVGLLAGYAKNLSSRFKALAPPVIFAGFATLFAISIVCPTMVVALGFNPATLSIVFGAATVVSAKWSKYTLFEAANSEAWKRIFGKPFETAMKMWQQPIKGTTGKISKASAATLSTFCAGNPIMLPIALFSIIVTWYSSASYLNPAEKVESKPSDELTKNAKSKLTKDNTGEAQRPSKNTTGLEVRNPLASMI